MIIFLFCLSYSSSVCDTHLKVNVLNFFRYLLWSLCLNYASCAFLILALVVFISKVWVFQIVLVNYCKTWIKCNLSVKSLLVLFWDISEDNFLFNHEFPLLKWFSVFCVGQCYFVSYIFRSCCISFRNGLMNLRYISLIFRCASIWMILSSIVGSYSAYSDSRLRVCDVVVKSSCFSLIILLVVIV